MLRCCQWGMNLRLPRSPTLPVMAIWTCGCAGRAGHTPSHTGDSGSEQQQLLSLLGRLAQLAPMRGASEAELEAARCPFRSCCWLWSSCCVLPRAHPGSFPRVSNPHPPAPVAPEQKDLSSVCKPACLVVSRRLVWFVKDLSEAVALWLGDTTSALYSFSVVSLSAHRSWASVLGSLTP